VLSSTVIKNCGTWEILHYFANVESSYLCVNFKRKNTYKKGPRVSSLPYQVVDIEKNAKITKSRKKFPKIYSNPIKHVQILLVNVYNLPKVWADIQRSKSNIEFQTFSCFSK
jgi:hypothetical protein